MAESYKRILTIQDISCVGQCSLTVALPVISACDVECAVLPSAVLSTHTGGFKGFTFRDLTDDMPLIEKHWNSEGIKFDAIYTGYLGSVRQIGIVKGIAASTAAEGAPIIVDPAMADNGKLYYGFDDEFVKTMRTLIAGADYVLPNITEASFLTGIEYRETYDEAYVSSQIKALLDLGAKNVIMTGIGYRDGFTGVTVCENGETRYYEHIKLPKGCHGTGDIYASAFVGALMRGLSAYDSAVTAADFVLKCIEVTQDYPDHWYGARFESSLPSLISAIAAGGAGK